MHLKSVAPARSYLRSVKNFATKANRLAQWKPAVGLEIHAQINSNSKLFSGARADFDKPVNTCVSLFDCATPGTLPVLNKKCVEAGILTALALSCQINEISLFDRKHYFYADLPTGYQITQQRKPLATNGEILFNVSVPGECKDPYVKISKIKQIQLEQDSGRSLHDTDRSLIDLNRAGIPLMELVFEPDLSDGEEAAALVKELILILQRLKTCSCKMEQGELRVDANVSVSRLDEPLGTRTEIKNISSIRGVAGAIKYEINRQIQARELGEKIVNETLAWDAENRQTVTMRDKEDEQDYRFMPEPNLPPLRVHVQKNHINTSNLIDVNSLSAQLPILPEDSRQNLIKEYGLKYITSVTIVNEEILLGLFQDIMRDNANRNPKTVANVLLNEFLTVINKKKLQLDSLLISSRQLGELIDLLQSEVINLDTLKKILVILIKECGKMPNEIVEEFNLAQINDDVELTNLTRAVFDTNPKLVSQYKAGKLKVFHGLANEVAKKSQGRANMKKVTVILQNLLQ